MEISIIVALADNNLIGNNNKMPWHLPADLKHFKAITMGKPIIMGRKTYESIGKPLPGRRNIIISKNQNFQCAGCEVYTSLTTALATVQDCAEVMIIGGAEIYKLALPMADKIHLTLVHGSFTGDTYFPKWNTNEWREIEHADFASDEKNQHSYSFVVLERSA